MALAGQWRVKMAKRLGCLPTSKTAGFLEKSFVSPEFIHQDYLPLILFQHYFFTIFLFLTNFIFHDQL